MPKRRFVWDTVNDCVLQETDETGATLATYSHEPVAYGSLVSQQRSGQTSYFHFDALGSTRLLTDDSQAVTDTYTHDAWGNEITSTGATENAYRWVGRVGYERSLQGTSCYARARTYSFDAGRWLSVDRLFFITTGIHQYAYVSSSPALFVDPSGLWAQLDGNIWFPDSENEKITALVTRVAPLLNAQKNQSCITPRDPDDPEFQDFPASALCCGGYKNAKSADWQKHNGTKCALYDVSNLTSTAANSLTLSVGADNNGYIGASTAFYGIPMGDSNLTGAGAATRISAAASRGATPLSSLTFIGHGDMADPNKIGGMGGGGGLMSARFRISDLNTAGVTNGPWKWPSFAAATQRHMPPGCWFTTNASVRYVGCKTAAFAATTAAGLLRTGASAFGTNTWTFAGAGRMGWGMLGGPLGNILMFNPAQGVANTVRAYHNDPPHVGHWVESHGNN